jgi:transcriptional regulator with GAF, ATPase, and Fis domain
VSEPLVALIDVPRPYVSAFLEAAPAQGFRTLVGQSSTWAETRVALAVVGVDAETEAAPERIKSLRKSLGGAPLVVLADRLSTEVVVGLVRAGAADVFGLPAPPADLVARALLRAAPHDAELEIVGNSREMQRLRAEVAALATMRSTVLITGETGVGKGVVARSIHRLSGLSDRPFVHVDCASLAPSLLESELFGHERGEFTGAVNGRAGRFELAGDGTVFLDEIGELEPGVQRKLLRVLQDREYERVGGTKTRILNARVIAATNRNLRVEVEEGRFRADLLFRLDVFRIHVPPLRERPSDIPALARVALQRAAARLGMDPPPLSDGFYRALGSYRWPGNMRELMSAFERLLVSQQSGLLDEGPLEAVLERMWGEPAERREAEAHAAHLPDAAQADAERIEAALRSTGGNISRAARRLSMPRSTLRYWIRIYDLDGLIPRD